VGCNASKRRNTELQSMSLLKLICPLKYFEFKFFEDDFSLGRSNIPDKLNNSTSHSLHLPAYEDGTGCSETSAHKIQTPGNYPEESIYNIQNTAKF